MPEQRFEYQPKKSRVPKILAQILSTLFTAVMISGLISCFTSDLPKYIPYDKVNLYNTNEYDVYELKDLKIISKYSSDEDFNYYLVFLPDKEKTDKVASFRCRQSYFEDYDDENKDMAGFVFTAGVIVDTTDWYSDDVLEAYNSAVDNLKKSTKNVVSTELAFGYACEANEKDFRDYYDTEKSAETFSAFILSALSIIGVALMFASFWESKSKYQQVSNYSGVYFEPNFNNRFE